MNVIKIRKQEWKAINPTRTGVDNQRLDNEYPILFNANEMITAEASIYGGTKISYKKAMVDVLYCKETLEEIYTLILKNN